MFGKRRKKNQPRSSAQPLQGNSRPSMFSYHANRSNIQGERLQPDETLTSKSIARKLWSLLPTIIAVFVILAAITFNLTLSTIPNVVILGEHSNSLRGDEEMYQKLIQYQMEESLFYRSKLTMDTNKLTRELKQQYPEFSDIAVVIPLVGRKPVIQLKPAQGLFILKNTRGAYLIDSSGRAILNYQDSTPSDKPVVIDQTDADVEVGSAILPTESIEFINEMLGQLNAQNLKVESMTLPARAIELHVKLVSQPYIIKFNLEGDARVQVGTYLALRDKLITESKTPAEYIDVRVEEKAFYR